MSSPEIPDRTDENIDFLHSLISPATIDKVFAARQEELAADKPHQADLSPEDVARIKDYNRKVIEAQRSRVVLQAPQQKTSK